MITFTNPFIVLVPNLHGTWKGTLQSSWINPETGNSPDPIEITIFIRQNFNGVSVEMRTEQMVSRSYIAGFKRMLILALVKYAIHTQVKPLLITFQVIPGTMEPPDLLSMKEKI